MSIYLKVYKILLILLLSSCSGKNDNTENTRQAIPPSGSEGGVIQEFYLNDTLNQQIASLKFSPEQDVWEIVIGEDYFRGIIKNGKRKFYTKTGETFAEVKFKDDGFKLRAPDGTLLWKIKLKDDKIKIGDREEMNDPYELKIANSYYAKLIRDGEEHGSITLNPDYSLARVDGKAGNYTFAGRELTFSPAVMLIEEIPTIHQLIIMTQLIHEGR